MFDGAASTQGFVVNLTCWQKWNKSAVILSAFENRLGAGLV